MHVDITTYTAILALATIIPAALGWIIGSGRGKPNIGLFIGLWLSLGACISVHLAIGPEVEKEQSR